MHKILIGVLALQGAFAEHAKTLEKLNGLESNRDIAIDIQEIRSRTDLINKRFDGLIIPGGESTAMGKLLHDLELYDELKELIQSGIPTFGTCAGMILLAREIANDKPHLGLMNIKVKRNAYGRQLGSFYHRGVFGPLEDIPMTFIRSPYIVEAGKSVEVLAEADGKMVAAREGHLLACSFHPELTEDTRIHRYFIQMIKEDCRMHT